MHADLLEAEFASQGIQNNLEYPLVIEVSLSVQAIRAFCLMMCSGPLGQAQLPATRVLWNVATNLSAVTVPPSCFRKQGHRLHDASARGLAAFTGFPRSCEPAYEP